ncbi:GumC family protein [Alteromonas sp. a30]|uniref:GumC family protein n=1 Tax=Alteromonas sp. a30 TaxID=2730917 RepID=UPI002280AA59|nr:polysaccharide biosynthesis tyrosine autokinase [Alteromonas sp. a30]MCY7296105.1 polysaccharide biosynthesis tyrosine autokinase [Alteromonas sp. a30]
MSTNNDSHNIDSYEFIDLFDIWRVLMRYKFYIVGFVSIVAVLAVLAVGKITPTYIATATLLLKEKKESMFSLPGGFDLGLNNDETIVTEMEVLSSRNMMTQVIDELNLAEEPAFAGQLNKPGYIQQLITFMTSTLGAPESQPEPSPPTEKQLDTKQFQMLGLFNRDLSVSSIPQTRMITVSFESSSPELARDVANTLAELYIERNERIFKDDAERESQWLDERLYQMRVQMQDLEQNISDFLESNDLIVTNGVSGLSAGKVKQLKSQVLKEQQRNLELSIINTVVEEAGMKGISALLSIDYVVKNPTIQSLRHSEMQVQQKVNELSTLYGQKHPKMIAAQSELKQAHYNVMSELRSMAANAKTNLNASNEVLKELKAELKMARQEHQQNQKLENKFIRLTREIDSSRELYDKLLQQSLHNRLATASHVGIASIIDPAIAPPFPAKPKKKVLVGIAIILALAASVIMILIIDAMTNNSFRSANDVSRYLDVPLLGIMPKIKNGKTERSLGEREHKRFLEAIRTVKTNLLLQLRQDPNKKLIAVTSTFVGEGKSLLAKSLAESLCRQGKVLLVDADLRRPSLGQGLGVPENHPGLADLLKGEASFIDCVYMDEATGLAFLPAGNLCDDPLDLLFSPRFHLLLKRLKQHYKYVILDSVQAEAVSDAFVIAKKVDSLVYVVKANSTKREQVVTLFDRLRSQGASVSGVVATQVDVHNRQNKERFANYYDFDSLMVKKSNGACF